MNKKIKKKSKKILVKAKKVKFVFCSPEDNRRFIKQEWRII